MGRRSRVCGWRFCEKQKFAVLFVAKKRETRCSRCSNYAFSFLQVLGTTSIKEFKNQGTPIRSCAQYHVHVFSLALFSPWEWTLGSRGALAPSVSSGATAILSTRMATPRPEPSNLHGGGRHGSNYLSSILLLRLGTVLTLEKADTCAFDPLLL